MHSSSKNILIVVGEPSADCYGARLVSELRARRGGESLHFYGTGGDEMERAGVRLICHIRDLASIGPREALSHLRKYYATYKKLAQSAIADRPDLALLLDFPEFNLRLAKKIKRAGIKVAYYIGPQLWAWRRGRIRIVRKCVDKMLVILPFEEQYYRQRGIEAEFVGHPILEDFAPEKDRARFLGRLSLDPSRKTVALLPGSRWREVEYILPTMVAAAEQVLHRLSSQFLVSVAPSIEPDRIRRIVHDRLRGKASVARFQVAEAPARDVLANSDFGFVKSGTGTLEAALTGTPFLITYKISSISWHLGSILIRSPYKGLVNLIAGEEIVPEYLQAEATPEALSRTALEYLENPEKGAAMKTRLLRVCSRLGTRQASEAAASAIMSLL